MGPRGWCLYQPRWRPLSWSSSSCLAKAGPSPRARMSAADASVAENVLVIAASRSSSPGGRVPSLQSTFSASLPVESFLGPAEIRRTSPLRAAKRRRRADGGPALLGPDRRIGPALLDAPGRAVIGEELGGVVCRRAGRHRPDIAALRRGGEA